MASVSYMGCRILGNTIKGCTAENASGISEAAKNYKNRTRTGADRANDYSNGWQQGSLKKAVDTFAPNAMPYKTKTGKIIYLNEERELSLAKNTKEAAGIPESAQYKTHKFVYDGTSENRIVYEFAIICDNNTQHK